MKCSASAKFPDRQGFPYLNGGRIRSQVHIVLEAVSAFDYNRTAETLPA